VGYLFGSQDYHHGGQPTQCTPSETCTYDMWHDGGPGTDIVPQIDYSTDYYSELAIDRIQGRDRSRPFYMYLACEPSNGLPHHLTTGLRPLLLRRPGSARPVPGAARERAGADRRQPPLVHTGLRLK